MTSTSTSTSTSTGTGTTSTDTRPARRRLLSRLAAVGLVTAAASAAAVTTVGPASAVVVDTDHPIIKASHFDFGENWLVNAPQLGGNLTWDDQSGVMHPNVSGYLYLTKKECGRVKVEYYDTDPSGHVYLGESHTAKHCAPGNAKKQWWVTLNSYGNKDATHVHVRLEKPNGTGGWNLVAYTTADLN